MIQVDCIQGSEEWGKARAGIVTASEMKKIYTSTGKKSTQAKAYRNTLLAEWLVGGPVDTYTNVHIEHGNEYEAEARAFYEFQSDAEVIEVGFCYADERKHFGASPDGLVGDDGLLEIKCPKASTHIGYLLSDKPPSDYFVQMQGQMLVTGRQWVDFTSYYTGLSSLILRLDRNEVFIANLSDALHEFIAGLHDQRAELEARGYAPKREDVA